MKFDYIIGNPPYNSANKNNGNNFQASIYPQFMEACFKIADKVELITPARFLSGAGNNGKEWNEKILKDEHFKVLKWEMDAKKVFPTTGFKGGGMHLFV